MAIGVPLLILSPTFTSRVSTTPACDDGISIDALSLSTVIRLCSSFTASPALTKISITATSAKSPMSGTTTVTGPDAATGASAAAAAGAGAGAAADGAGAGATADADAAPSASTSATSVPWLTLSPSETFSSFTTPATDDGISIEALSLSTVSSDCSSLIVSPGFTSSSITATLSKSPMSGTFTSTNAMFDVSVVLVVQAYSGLTLPVSMPYFLIASATTAGLIAPSSARALSAATTT